MQEAFPGGLPANVVVEAPDVNAPAAQAAIQELEERALASGRMFEPITVEVNDDGTVANITVPMAGDGEERGFAPLSRRYGTTSCPRRSGPCRMRRPVSRVSRPTGWTRRTRSSRSPLVFAFVLLFAFVVMLVAFRSLVIAAKAMLNLLSVAAAYGVLVLVFQHGIGKDFLGFSSTEGISRRFRCSSS